MKKNIFQKLFLILMFLFCLLGIIVQIDYAYKVSNLYTIIFVILLPIILVIINNLIKKVNIGNKYVNVIVILVIISFGIGLRIAANGIFKTMPTSDFATPHNVYYLLKHNYKIFSSQSSMATISNYQRYYAVFPAWFPYMKVLSLLFDTFGFDLLVVKIFNYFMFVCSEFLIYFIFINQRKKAYFAMFIFSCLPSLVLYSNVTTPDHITIFLILLFIYLWTIIIRYRRDKNYKKLCVFSFLYIVVLCLINLFKPLSIFGIVVIVCMEILCYLFPFSNKYFDIKNICYVLLFVLVSFFSIMISTKLLHDYVEEEINVKVVDSTGLYLLWGYSLNSNKNYDSSIGDKIYIDLLKKYDNNYILAIDEINGIAKKQIKDNLRYLPKIWYQKFRLVYQKESDIFEWASFNSDNKLVELNALKYQAKYNFISVSYLLFIFSMMGVSIFKCLINKTKVNELYYLILLVIIGYSLILVLGGVQSRYKSLIYGPFCLVAACYIDENKRGVKK